MGHVTSNEQEEPTAETAFFVGAVTERLGEAIKAYKVERGDKPTELSTKGTRFEMLIIGVFEGISYIANMEVWVVRPVGLLDSSNDISSRASVPGFYLFEPGLLGGQSPVKRRSTRLLAVGPPHDHRLLCSNFPTSR